jgi:uncharacterized protein (TIGR02246 family)
MRSLHARLLHAAALALLILPACTGQRAPSAIQTLEVKAAVDSLWAGYAHASDQKDAAAFGKLFTEDAVLVYSNAATAHGREQIQAFLASRYAGIDPTGLRIEPDETKVSGSVAVQSGDFQERFIEKNVERTNFGRFVLVAEAGTEGSWRIRRLVAIEDSTRDTP